MKPDQIATVAKNLRAAVAQLNALESSTEKFEAQAAALKEQAFGSLDLRAGAEYSALRGAMELATTATPRARALLSAAIDSAMTTQSAAHAFIFEMHRQIDEAISQKVVASVHEDVRASVNPALSKPFLAEAQARPDTTVLHIFYGHGTRDAQLKQCAEDIAGRLDTMAKETERATSVAKKLGVAA